MACRLTIWIFAPEEVRARDDGRDHGEEELGRGREEASRQGQEKAWSLVGTEDVPLDYPVAYGHSVRFRRPASAGPANRRTGHSDEEGDDRSGLPRDARKAY